jgi:hypothetical protein
MYHILRWLSVSLFISIPALLISAIWFGEIKFLFISGVTGVFSVLAGAFADTLKKIEMTNGEQSATLF